MIEEVQFPPEPPTTWRSALGPEDRIGPERPRSVGLLVQVDELAAGVTLLGVVLQEGPEQAGDGTHAHEEDRDPDQEAEDQQNHSQHARQPATCRAQASTSTSAPRGSPDTPIADLAGR